MSKTTTATAYRPVGASVFTEPDVLTAHEFFRVFRQKGQMNPEERLMFAVLTDAIECFQKYLDASSGRCRALFNDADAWIQCRDSLSPFSFEHICSVLNISPNYLRSGLARWRTARACDRLRRRRIREPLRYRYRVKNNRMALDQIG